jgi:hypothetical protein
VIAFHRFLISAAIVFCVVIGIWLFSEFRVDGGAGLLVLAVSFAGAAVGLGYYLKHLQRFLHRR